MTTQSENELFTPDEQDWINFVRYWYVKEHAPALLHPGVTFTPEQRAKILELVETGETAEAQKSIINKLSEENG